MGQLSQSTQEHRQLLEPSPAAEDVRAEGWQYSEAGWAEKKESGERVLNAETTGVSAQFSVPCSLLVPKKLGTLSSFQRPHCLGEGQKNFL